MNSDSEKGNETWKQILGTIVQILLYPVHFAIRLIARILLVVTRSVILSVLVITILAAKYFYSILSKVFESSLSEHSDSMKLLSVFLDVLLSNLWIIPVSIIVLVLILHGAENLWTSLLNVNKKIVEVFRDRWFPGLDIKKSLQVTWKCYGENIGRSFMEIFTRSGRLLIILLGIIVALIGVSFFPIEQADHPHPEMQEDIDQIRQKINGHLEGHVSKQPTSYLFEKGTRFSLVYPEGDLISKEGICPRGSNWEKLKAIRTKSSAGRRTQDRQLKLRVKGFASVSPVTALGDTSAHQSNLRNLRIANQRAEAVIYGLTLADFASYNSDEFHLKCVDALEKRLIWDQRTTVYDSIWQAGNMDVIYNPWNEYIDMVRSKPAIDALQDGTRQRDLEFFNRSVQISVE